MELAHLGMGVYQHVITPRDLATLRQNFLAKNKRKVFNRVHAVLKAGDYLGGAWDTPAENQLFGVEIDGYGLPQQIDLAVGEHSRR